MTSQPNAAQSGTFTIGGNLKINRLGFGSMRITGQGVWGDPKDPKECRAVLKRALELGINFIDTADSYGPATSETLIAEALHPYPKGLVIATKGGLTRPGPRRLGTRRPRALPHPVRRNEPAPPQARLHRPLPAPPLRRQNPHGRIPRRAQETPGPGQIRHLGLSEVDVPTLKKAQKHITVVSVQNLYNIGDRKHEDVVAYCEKENIAFIPWFPMAGGDLAKPGGVLDRAAKKYNATVSQLALAWLLHHSPVQLPIPGTSSVKHLEENTAAAALKLTAAEWKEIESAAK